MRRDWWAPLTGVAFLVLLILSFIVGGEPPDANSPPQEIVDHYVDNKDSVQIGAVISGVAAAFLVFFAGSLRRALRDAEGPGGVLSAVAFAGAVIMATGAAIDGMISIALAERADDIEPVGVQTLQALWDNDWLPIALGITVLLFASGLSIARHGALPRWLGWVALLIAVATATPIGFVGFMGAALWVLVVSILLALRLRGEAPASRPPGAAPLQT